MLAPGAALLSPRGKVSEDGMARFFRRHQEGVWDLPDFEARTDELAGLSRAGPHSSITCLRRSCSAFPMAPISAER